MANLLKSLHVSHLMRCITGLPGTRAELDTSRLAIAYYALSALDILGALDDGALVKDTDRQEWRDWLWNVSVHGEHGFGFRTGSSADSVSQDKASIDRYEPPHIIMTYTALLSLSILRDDFSRLNRSGLVKFLNSTQHNDGSFSPLPTDAISSERDLRLTFCSFAICSMLGDWTGIDVPKAVQFIARCRTYEGGYGEAPGCEAQGGPTYCAIASLRILHASSYNIPDFPLQRSFPAPFLTHAETAQTIRWLVQRQRGGFQGRTEKNLDACYSFWCGAALKILSNGEHVDPDANAHFICSCQFKYGGIANSPGENPDPYHTYLSLASLSLHPPTEQWVKRTGSDPAIWRLHSLDPLLNIRVESAAWAKKHIPQIRGRHG